jgi:hypothetical protein
MEPLQIRETATGLVVDGFPDAVKLIKIDGPTARHAADLSLHKHDLEFAYRCLVKITEVSPDDQTLQQALWTSALISYFKCFNLGGGVRSGLDQDLVYAGNEAALACFEYFSHLRSKHVVHDVNPFIHCTPGAVLNREDDEYKIAKITFTNEYTQTLDQQPFDSMVSLVREALAFVEREFDTACAEITKDLEAKPYAELFGQEVVQLRGAANHTHVSRSRASGNAPGRKSKREGR